MEGYKKIKVSGGITEYNLVKNGLTVLLMEENSTPVAALMVTYLVGSRNEAIGYTGATHILEHLMFKGSAQFNKEQGKTIWTVLQNVGARINASTWLDRTNYFELLPSEHLETAIAIEADRMRKALLRDNDRQLEMTVVRNEFERGENDPWEALDKNIWATAYQAHPYHHSTIGWRSDIEGVSTERLRQFYDTFYRPDNATVTVIGAFDTAQVLAWIKTYFGQYPSSPAPIPEMYTTEPKQEGARRFIIKRNGELGIVGMAFKTPEGRHADQYALAVLGSILGIGKTSHLYRALVDKGLATNASLWCQPFHDNGLLMTYVFMAPGTGHQEVEDIVREVFQKVQEQGITEEEVNRAKAQVKAEVAFSRDGSYSIASALNEAIALGDWTYYTNYLERLSEVTPDRVRQIARNYLNEDQGTTGWFVPLAAGGTGQAVGAPVTPAVHPGGPWLFRPEGAESQVDAAQAAAKSKDVPVSTNLAAQITDGEVLPGLRLVTRPMGVEDVVTIYGSFYGGDIFSPAENQAVAEITATMLDKGSTKRDKFEISALLESVGARVGFSSDDYRVSFSARCLKDDVPLVLELLAEQLRQPAFHEADLDTLRQRMIGSLLRQGEDTDFQTRQVFSRNIYPAGHPNHILAIDELKALIEKITVKDLKTFHQQFYGLGSMNVVATGDIDRDVLEVNLRSRFGDWQRVALQAPSLDGCRGRADLPATTEVKTMADKTSVDLMLGLAIGIDREHPDYLPLYLASYILGGNFAARLMATVRDEEGLTYSIGAGVGGVANGKDGYWAIHGTFAPNLLQQGQASALKQLDLWIAEGVTEEELAVKKTTIAGTFKVGLATTRGVAAALLDILERGREISYIDAYLGEINAVTLDQVNEAIRRYIRPDHLLHVAAGSIDKDLQPLDEK